MDEVQRFIANNHHQLGYIMQEASRQWIQKDPVGAFTVGDCNFVVTKHGQYHELLDKVERYEKIIHAIANIDTLFINGDGSEREWDYKEAMEEIERLVIPVWVEHCKKSRSK